MFSWTSDSVDGAHDRALDRTEIAPGRRTLTQSLAAQRAPSPSPGAGPVQYKAAETGSASAAPAQAQGPGVDPFDFRYRAQEEAEGDRDNNDADAGLERAAAPPGESGAGEPGGEEDGGDAGADVGIDGEEEQISDEEIQAELIAAQGGAAQAGDEPAPGPQGAAPAAGGGIAQARAGAGGLDLAADLPATSAGSPLEPQVRTQMEHAFQTDFSRVTVHADSPRASALGALAYTEGNAVHMAPGQYAPGSRTGRELLGHELTHVVQQREGRVSATGQAKGVAVNDDPGLESEADELGRRAAAGEVVYRSAGLGLRQQLGTVQMARPVVQMVRTHFGDFQAPTYHTLRSGRKPVGVEIRLRFSPGRSVNAKQIAMVQAVRSAEAGAPIPINPTVALRSISNASAIPMRSAVGTDEGFHIDQSETNRNPLYAVEGAPAADVNLNQGPTPAAVRRMTRKEQRAEAARTGITGVRLDGWGSHGHRFKDGRRLKVKAAELHDTPSLPNRTKNAEQLFETTALATDGVQNGTYYGSVQWGWRTNDKGRFRRLPLKVISQGVPSSTFMKAAEIWNPGTTSAGVANLALPTVDVHILNARTQLNPGLRGRRHTRLRRGTRVQILNASVAQPDGRVLAQIRVVDGSRTGLEGLVDPAVLQDERP